MQIADLHDRKRLFDLCMRDPILLHDKSVRIQKQKQINEDEYACRDQRRNHFSSRSINFFRIRS